MKHIAFALCALTLVVLAGCQSAPKTSERTVHQFGEVINGVTHTQIDSNRFDVLGSVSVECEPSSGASYVLIYEKAKELYTNVDEIINIHVDYRTDYTIQDGSVSSTLDRIIMTGLAVKYRK